MILPPPVVMSEDLEKFRHLLFHLQMRCGSIHEIFRFFEEEKSMEHFETLKTIDPALMPQLLAREHVLEARHSETPEAARQLLETALDLDPYCPEACFEFAQVSPTPESSMMWFQRSMDATVAMLGGQGRFAELMADFRQAPWKQLELHTYLKAKASLAEKLYRTGHYEVAAPHFEDLLEWNPDDDLGLHQFLMANYLCQNNLEAAAYLKRCYSNDWSAQWYYLRAFLQFKLEGRTRKSHRLLFRALRRNLWVPVYLLGQLEPPAQQKPSDNKPFKEGSRSEAGECVHCIAPAFVEDPGLVNWVRNALEGGVEGW